MKIRVKVYLNVHGVSQVGDWEEKNKHADRYEILGLGLRFYMGFAEPGFTMTHTVE